MESGRLKLGPAWTLGSNRLRLAYRLINVIRAESRFRSFRFAIWMAASRCILPQSSF